MLKIKKGYHLPVHVQLREQLKHQIETGVHNEGSQLPTVRQLSAELNINYNTVRQVYKDLERRGYVSADQGRGVFVTHKKRGIPQERKRLHDLIQDALAEANSQGVSKDDLLLQLFTHSAVKKTRSPKIRLLFLECNPADLKHHIDTIRKNLEISVEGCLISEIKDRKDDFLFDFEIVATTMYHYFEVRTMLDSGINLEGMVVQPSLSKVVLRIASLPANTKIGLVCTTDSSANKMKQALIGNGLTHVKFVTSGLNERNRLRSIFENADELFVSRMGLNAHSGSWPFDRSVQMYDDDLDPRAISLLRSKVEAHKTAI
jgi:GntR family transcriptional regulator